MNNLLEKFIFKSISFIIFKGTDFYKMKKLILECESNNLKLFMRKFLQFVS